MKKVVKSSFKPTKSLRPLLSWFSVSPTGGGVAVTPTFRGFITPTS